MLKHYPDTAVFHAVDGIISPAALGLAARGAAIEHFARRRAAAELEAVAAQKEAALRDARMQGHREGYIEAVEAALPYLVACLEDAQRLRSTLLEQMRDILEASLVEAGVHVDLVVRRLDQIVGAEAQPIVLHVPEGDEVLGPQVRKRLAEAGTRLKLKVLATRSPYPLLQSGELVCELDPATPILAAVELTLDPVLLDGVARARAEAYVETFEAAQRRYLPVRPTGD